MGGSERAEVVGDRFGRREEANFGRLLTQRRWGVGVRHRASAWISLWLTDEMEWKHVKMPRYLVLVAFFFLMSLVTDTQELW